MQILRRECKEYGKTKEKKTYFEFNFEGAPGSTALHKPAFYVLTSALREHLS